MKNKIIYFAITVLLFVVVFYQNDIGINLSLWAIITAILSFYGFMKKSRVRDFWIALIGTLIFAFSFAWYRDLASFLGIIISMHWLAMIGFDPKQKMLKALILVPLNYLMMLPNLSGLKFSISKKQTNRKVQNLIAYALIPMAITALFVLVYAMASKTLTEFFTSLNFNFDFSLLNMIALMIIGSVLMFGFWFFKLPKNWQAVTYETPEDFKPHNLNDSPEAELTRKSGEITFIMLNVVLLIFSVIYGYENFFKVDEISSISQNVHERVYAVIASIVMAIALIMFFFRSRFNFDPKNSLLKNLTFSWILLNAILVFIALIKNGQYVSMLGLTEKRLGVYAFLILSLLGLFFTYRKLKFVKTNWFLLHRMSKSFYFTLIVIAVFNWSWIITFFNIETGKIEGDPEYHKSLPHNYLIYKNYSEQKGEKFVVPEYFSSVPKFDGRLYDLWVAYHLSENQY